MTTSECKGLAAVLRSALSTTRRAMTSRDTRMLRSAIVLAATVLLPAAAIAGIDITISESGTTTVVSYSGSINTTNSMNPAIGLVEIGSSTDLFFVSGTPGSQTFGTGTSVLAATASGSPVWFNFTAPALLGLPVGYASSSLISAGMTFPGTFTTLGITPNITRTYSWGGGGPGRTVTLTTGSSASGVPEIDPTGMGTVLALVAGALALAERRRLSP